MVQQPQRRRARAIAISQTIEAQRAAVTVRVLMGAGALAAMIEAAWVLHRLVAAS